MNFNFKQLLFFGFVSLTAACVKTPSPEAQEDLIVGLWDCDSLVHNDKQYSTEKLSALFQVNGKAVQYIFNSRKGLNITGRYAEKISYSIADEEIKISVENKTDTVYWDVLVLDHKHLVVEENASVANNQIVRDSSNYEASVRYYFRRFVY